MPELPEVETVRRQAEAYIVGKTITSVVVHEPKVIHGDADSLVGAIIKEARRFSKLLVLDCSNSYSLAIHLKMTGRVVYAENNSTNPSWDVSYSTDKHTHFDLSLNHTHHLYFYDYRRFGYVDIVPTDAVSQLSYIQGLGKEFFKDLTVEDFKTVLLGSSRAIKVVLLDQSKMGGVGNIYANEALWTTRIHPQTPAKQISAPQAAALFYALEEVMRDAIGHLGASSDNFRDLLGNPGDAQKHFSVYGRQQQPCLRCTATIQKIFIGGRGTYLCPVCQKYNSVE